MIPNTLEAFAAYHQFRQQATAVLTDYCAALHARSTSALPLSVQDALARKENR